MQGPKTVGEALQRIGLIAFGRFLSPYRGVVHRVDDPETRGRIQARIPRTGPASPGENEGVLNVWIDPMCGAGQDRGMFWPPEKGDLVWIYFDEGSPKNPLAYVGGWFTTPGFPSEFAYTMSGDNVVGPEKRGMITRSGHALLFDDSTESTSVKLIWRKPATGDAALQDRSKSAKRSGSGIRTSMLELLKDGSVVVTAADGSTMTLSAEGMELKVPNKATLTLKNDGSISIEATGAMTLAGTSLLLDFPDISMGRGAVSPLLKANEFIPQYLAHIHGTPVGPTTPPTPTTGAERAIGVKSR